MKKILRFDSTIYSSLVNNDYEVSATALSLMAQEVLSEGSASATKTQKRLDFLFHEFLSQTPKQNDSVESLAALNEFLFGHKSFKSTNSECNGNPGDFFISKTLESRNGHPLILAIIYRELARRAQTAPVNFVNFPGFFLIKILYRHQLLFIDPSDNGRLLTITDLQSKLSIKYGKNLSLNGTFLETPSEIQTITRFLSKLKNIYAENKSSTHHLTVLDMLIATNPQRSVEFRERGMLLYHLGASSEATRDLAAFVEHSQPSPEVEKIKTFLSHIEHPNVTPLF